jgi:peptide/nickel transport system permease protein
MRYILKRLLLLIPSLFLLVIAGFLLIESAPFNPEELALETEADINRLADLSQKEIQKKQIRRKYGLDLPVFYFRVTHLADIDTLQRISSSTERQLIRQLLIRNGNKSAVMNYYQSLKEWLDYSIINLQTEKDSLVSESVRDAHAMALSLVSTWNTETIEKQINSIQQIYDSTEINERLKQTFHVFKSSFILLKEQSQPWKTWIPSIRFYANNRFHRWIFGDGKTCKGIIRGDFGISWHNQRPVLPYLFPKLLWSALLTFISVLMAYAVAIPLGMAAASKLNSVFDRMLQTVLLILFSLPSFLAAIVLMRTFSNPDVLNWFPTGGIAPTGGFDEHDSFMHQFMKTIPYLILPVIAYAYGSFVFITRLTRELLIQEEQKAYAVTAKAKGLSKPVIFRRHLLRNSLLPLITVFSQVFPASVAGSVIIESIFTIPGIGQEALLAVYQMNYPVLVAILFISGLFTIIGYLISDVLYVFADPRIRLDKNKPD